MMDQLARHFYEMAFELQFRKLRGDAFQQFFGRVMNMAFPGDFVQTRPWGNRGDEKCDGYLPSARRFFQCYAPNELSERETLEKLNEDFTGALPHSGDFFDGWVFVHNASDGRIPTWLVKELERLRGKNSTLTISTMGFDEMRNVVFELDPNNLIALLGPAPTQRAMLSLGLAELKPMLAYLARQAPPEDVKPGPISAQKLAYNDLPESIDALLTAGMTKARLFETYIARGLNKELGMQVATAFRSKYDELRTERFDGVEIFNHLREFAMGPFQPDSETEVACLAILAWLFEACDIFEHPPPVP